jgi:hypothetical protein
VRIQQRAQIRALIGEQPANLRRAAGLDKVHQQAVGVQHAIVQPVERTQPFAHDPVVFQRIGREHERARHHGRPIGIRRAIYVRRLALLPVLERKFVIRFVGILAAGEESGLRIAQHRAYVSRCRD